jgi:hypothetical protein
MLLLERPLKLAVLGPPSVEYFSVKNLKKRVRKSVE